MKVLDFIRENENWEELLVQEPYHIKAVWEGDYVLLKYNQLASDFNNQIVRECRGCILCVPSHKEAYPVCVPFYKFGNYGESYVPEIDWDSAVVLEKVDGSLMKLWYHNNKWHVSTNGTIDARKAPTQVEGVSFYDMFMRALEKSGNPQDFFECLNKHLTYMFELVSPETRVTIEYPEPALYYLGARNIKTLQEITYMPMMDYDFVEKPKIFYLKTLEDCINAVNQMGADEEGFVVCDKYFNRVKIKSPEYLIASKVRNNNVLTTKRIIEAMRAGYLDDLYAYAPDHRDFIDSIINAYHTVAKLCEINYAAAEMQFATHDYPWHQVVHALNPEYYDYCFRHKANKVKDAYEYLERLSLTRLVDWVQEYIKEEPNE